MKPLSRNVKNNLGQSLIVMGCNACKIAFSNSTWVRALTFDNINSIKVRRIRRQPNTCTTHIVAISSIGLNWWDPKLLGTMIYPLFNLNYKTCLQ